MDENITFEDPNWKAIEEEANKTNPLLAMTKTQIGKIMADGAILASLRQNHGVTEEALTQAIVANASLTLNHKVSDSADLSFKFDSQKNGFFIQAKIKF